MFCEESYTGIPLTNLGSWHVVWCSRTVLGWLRSILPWSPFLFGSGIFIRCPMRFKIVVVAASMNAVALLSSASKLLLVLIGIVNVINSDSYALKFATNLTVIVTFVVI
ncbi:unnamed protein product [Dracunculus medinensis]|uniref:7TM_GPCR_Srx domain-containing protein n=1 Tax=Dracunculus medinensis TaxID=318479 RepID=A0A0N4U3N6_DRAME|nr:unnamed protein product [Dracunculus medinensis]